MSDLLETIPDVDPENWIPEPGDGVEGTVIERYDSPDQFHEGELVPTVVVRTDDDEYWSITGYRAGLRSEILKNDPEIGDRFAAKYVGAVPIKNGKYKGKDFHKYRTAVRRGNTLTRSEGVQYEGASRPAIEVHATGTVTPPPAAKRPVRKAEVPADEPPF